MKEGFPWTEFMRLGLGTLRLSPGSFWAATPREIAAAFPRGAREVVDRAAVTALMQRFPDEM